MTGIGIARVSWEPQGGTHSGRKVWSGDRKELRANPGKDADVAFGVRNLEVVGLLGRVE